MQDEITTQGIALQPLRHDARRAATPEPPVPQSDSTAVSSPSPPPELSLLNTSLIYLCIGGTQLISSLAGGLIAVALPRIATDLALSDSLLLWPAAIYKLVTAVAVLPSGAFSDVLGARNVYVVGTLLLCLMLLATGLARTAGEFLAARAVTGLAASLCLPSGVALMTKTFPEGKKRNLGFALQGAAQPVGLSVGLFLAGFFVDSIGWRYGWYVAAIATSGLCAMSVWRLPREQMEASSLTMWRRLRKEVDWAGVALTSTCLGCLSYVSA